MARTRKASKGSRPKPNGGPIKAQITPIIIKSGSLEFDSPLLDFEDPQGKKTKQFKITQKGNLTEVSVLVNGKRTDVDTSAGKPIIVLTYVLAP